jgi:CspA family cold shock protein
MQSLGVLAGTGYLEGLHPRLAGAYSSTSIGRIHNMAAAVSGTIKRIVSDKGFGFVAAEDGTEYFFHNSACVGTRFDELREGQRVSFEKGQGPKGPRAENIRTE